jgi:hypothetical protein
LTVLNNATQHNDFNDLVGSYPCGVEIGGELVLRRESNVPFLYQTCYAFLTGMPSLNGILWQNQNWTIEIEGKYEALHQFIADYPY